MSLVFIRRFLLKLAFYLEKQILFMQTNKKWHLYEFEAKTQTCSYCYSNRNYLIWHHWENIQNKHAICVLILKMLSWWRQLVKISLLSQHFQFDINFFYTSILKTLIWILSTIFAKTFGRNVLDRYDMRLNNNFVHFKCSTVPAASKYLLHSWPARTEYGFETPMINGIEYQKLNHKI